MSAARGGRCRVLVEVQPAKHAVARVIMGVERGTRRHGSGRTLLSVAEPDAGHILHGNWSCRLNVAQRNSDHRLSQKKIGGFMMSGFCIEFCRIFLKF